MLRRLPTPVTITPDDLATLEDQIQQRLAYLHYRKTGEDPDGLFSDVSPRRKENKGQEEQQDRPVDPNDELKPLPGDSRTRIGGGGARERIMGTVPGARGR